MKRQARADCLQKVPAASKNIRIGRRLLSAFRHTFIWKAAKILFVIKVRDRACHAGGRGFESRPLGQFLQAVTHASKGVSSPPVYAAPRHGFDLAQIAALGAAYPSACCGEWQLSQTRQRGARR